MCKYFLYSCGWFEFSKYLNTWKHIACWIFISLRSICIVLTDCAWNVCMHLFMGHIVSSLHILKERIFEFMCILNFFLLGLCPFSIPHLLNFPQNFFKPMLFIGGVAFVNTWQKGGEIDEMLKRFLSVFI